MGTAGPVANDGPEPGTWAETTPGAAAVAADHWGRVCTIGGVGRIPIAGPAAWGGWKYGLVLVCGVCGV
ncbi:MAG: hypothetical protein OXU20_27795, partial [Myxococcales bacterium]|nr:hypothetical protein [Myxococcales bacterium]